VDLAQMQALIRSIPDFPKAGILFRDITPLLKDKDGFRAVIDLMSSPYLAERIDYVVAIEARGYMLGAPLAYKLHAGLIPVRKPGKLPYEKISTDYALEYGTNSLEIHNDAVTSGQRVLLVDDLLATGGTAAATKKLLERLGAIIVGCVFLVELKALDGRKQLEGTPVTAFIQY
jgi:adenine phosphoribosyltransferase